MFKEFREETDGLLRQMMEQDLSYTKIYRIMKSDTIEPAMKEVIYRYYRPLKNIFLKLTSTSSYPTLAVNDVTEFLKNSAVFGKDLPQGRMDQLMSATTYSDTKSKSSSKKELHRFEFIEFIVRVSIAKYKDTKKVNTFDEAFEMLICENILPNNTGIDGLSFR